MSKICERDGCENLVPYPRRQYCSVECGKIANRERGKLMERPSVRTRFSKRKYRTCLSCPREFLSDGPWNRICPRCTKSVNSTVAPSVLPHRIPGTAQHRADRLALENEMEGM